MTKTVRVIIVGLLVVWFCVAVLRTGYSFFKLGEDLKYFFMTEEKRNLEVYGDIYSFSKKVEKDFAGEKELVLKANDGREYFFLRYLLYPKKIYWESEDRAGKELPIIEYK